MKFGRLEIDNRDLLVAAGTLGLIALFGRDVAREIAQKTEQAKQPLSLLPDFESMRTITEEDLTND